MLQIEDYLKAGSIAGEVRENTRRKNWIGSTLEDICLIGFASPNFTNFSAVHFFGSSCFNINIRMFIIMHEFDFDKRIMGTTGFEPATSGTQSPNHTKLDYVPCVDKIMIPHFKHEL